MSAARAAERLLGVEQLDLWQRAYDSNSAEAAMAQREVLFEDGACLFDVVPCSKSRSDPAPFACRSRLATSRAATGRLGKDETPHTHTQ